MWKPWQKYISLRVLLGKFMTDFVGQKFNGGRACLKVKGLVGLMYFLYPWSRSVYSLGGQKEKRTPQMQKLIITGISKHLMRKKKIPERFLKMGHCSLLVTNLLMSQEGQASHRVPICIKPLFCHISLTVELVKYLLHHGSSTTSPHCTFHSEKSLREIFIVFYGSRASHLSYFIKYHES